VVSLPTDHEGGHFSLNYPDRFVTCDWSNPSNKTGTEPCIKWAAFYNDHEHQVNEKTSGHRVTLTYNLYFTRDLAHFAAKTLDTTTLSLYKTIQIALAKPDFFPHGRVIAILLSHAYPRSTKQRKYRKFTPIVLKGADMSLHETAIALGLRYQVASVHAYDKTAIARDHRYDCEPLLEPAHAFDKVNAEFRMLDVFDPDNFGSLTTSGNNEDCVGTNWGSPIPTRNYTWIKLKKRYRGTPDAARLAVSTIDEHSL
jgi:hypothetical protein